MPVNLETKSFEDLRKALTRAFQEEDTEAVDFFANYLDNNFTMSGRRADLPPMPSEPDDLTPGQLRRQQEREERGLGTKLLAGLEVAGTLGTGMTTGTLGGLAAASMGIAEEVKAGDFGTPDAAQRIQERFMGGVEGLTYTPRTEVGQEYLQQTGETIAPLVEPFAGLSQLQPLGAMANAGVRSAAGNVKLSGRKGPEIPQNILNLQETQRLLESGGGTLSPTQTGLSSSFRNMVESLGEVGLFSRRIAEQRNKANAEVISTRLQQMIDNAPTSEIRDRGGVGELMFDVIQQGKKAADDIYGRNLDVIRQQYGDIRVPTDPIANNLKAYLAAKTNETGSLLHKSTVNFVNSAIEALQDVKGLRKYVGEQAQVPVSTRSVRDLAERQKVFNAEISEIGTFGAEGFSPRASRQLAAVDKIIKGGLEKAFGNVSKDLLEAYRVNNAQFASTVDALRPKITANILSQAVDKKDFEPLGRTLIIANSSSKAKALMKSVDEAFDTMQRAGVPTDGLPVRNAQELKQVVRSAYLNNLLGEYVPSDPNVLFANQYTKLYRDTTRGNTAAIARAVLGEQYPDYVKLTRALKDAAKTPEGSFLGLAIRSREISQATRTIAQIGALGAVGTTVGSSGITSTIAAASIVFGAPYIAAKLATSKGAVDKLLKIERVKDINQLDPRATATLIDRVIATLNEEDQQIVREAIKEEEERLNQSQQ